MKGFLTSNEGRTSPDREGKANLMNDLADGGRDWEGIHMVNIKKILSTLCRALISLVEEYSVKISLYSL